ncbi:MAG: P1 family peptidase [Alphaproteobacteria bacterium]|nr:P1 family peptidase [Alphaproteobacteria bacterium]
MNKPGAKNLITDVPGIKVGNAKDETIRTGVTIIVPDAPAVAAVDSRGGGPGTRETDALKPDATVTHIHAVALAGGSAFGLDAASGAMSWLAAHGRGFEIAGQLVPIVPAAILFDLANGGDKSWTADADGARSPYRRLAVEAIAAARSDFELGNEGAGTGAKAGALKGGLGSASIILQNDTTVGAIAAVNSFGSVVMPGSNVFWAWALERDGELGGQTPPAGPFDLQYAFDGGQVGQNTCLGVIATNAALSRAQASRVAIMAQNGFARAVRPVHTPLDGDTVFVLATGGGRRGLDRPSVAELAEIGSAAADCLARAVARGVYHARSIWGLPGYKSL